MRTLLFASLVLVCTRAAASPLNGLWEIKQPWCPKEPRAAALQCKRSSTDAFAVRLKVSGSKICGTHSSVARNGGKIDEFGGDEVTILGSIDQGKARVRFVSSFGAKGAAIIELKGGFLYWNVYEEDGAESWIPSTATLKRNRSDRWGVDLDCSKPPAVPM